jgi:integrase
MQGHLYRRGKSSWGLVVDLPRSSTGKRRQRTETVRGTKKDAEARLTQLLQELNTGTFVEATKITVADYLKRWLADYAAHNVSRKTYERYEEIIRLHLIPAIGAHRLTELKPLHIQEAYSAALRNGRRDGKGGLSPQTVLHHHRILREALQQAARWQIAVRNPADAVEPPRVLKQEMRVLNEQQTVKLLEEAAATRWFIVIALAVTTGLRRGEILALRWEDIDLDNARIQVRRTLEQARGGLGFKEPKTDRGRRQVALGPEMVEILQRHRLGQIKERLALGQEYKNGDLVCARLHGTPLDPAEVTAAFSKLIGSLDLPRIRLHDLRHGHATHLLRLGIHPKVVSERLGHSGVAITLNTYSHVLPGMQEDAALRLDRALREARKAK